jgi:protein TonB
MMREKLTALAVSLIAYIAVVVSAYYLFAYRPARERAVHYVEKNSQSIEVSLAEGKRIRKSAPKSKVDKKARKRVEKKRRKKPRPAKKRESNRKRESGERIAKKSNRRKNPDTRSLFSNISRESRLKESTPAAKGSKSMKKSSKAGKGVVDRYLARVERTLKGWPAQVNFAGEEIDVYLKIYASGRFEYKILKFSDNREFNDALVAYLDTLRRSGFDPHDRKRPYEIEVKFIAHD